MMDAIEPMAAQIVIGGTFECRDADGNLLKTIELTAAIPLADIKAEEDGDQRSE